MCTVRTSELNYQQIKSLSGSYALLICVLISEYAKQNNVTIEITTVRLFFNLHVTHALPYNLVNKHTICWKLDSS